MFPSTWEGFGNPVIESIAYRRACAAYPYPVLAEIVAAGIRVFSTQQPDTVAKFLAEPAAVRERYFDANVEPGPRVVLARRSAGRDRRDVRRARVGLVVADDPVVARRARIARFAALGKRIGYLALAVAIVAFFVGVATSFPTWTVEVSIAGLAVSCVVLPIPIVLGVRRARRGTRGPRARHLTEQ